MNIQPTLHDQQIEALADSLVRRMWRGVILPGIGLQLALFVALNFTFDIASLAADDDDPPAVAVASLPDEGQPPAPSIENNATTSNAVQAIQADVIESLSAAELPAVEQPSTAIAQPAEVASNQQVEQLGEKHSEPTEVRELSIEPVTETRPMLPADRPAWVGAPNDTSERVHRLYVASFTATAREDVEADDMLDDPLVAAVRSYLDERVFPGQGAYNLPLSAEFVRSNLLDHSTSYVAAMTTQSGIEYQKWVVLQVTPEQREYFGGLLREHKQRQRMAMLGVGLASVLGLTGLANLAFNRRRRRYPNAVTPVTMAMMPGNVPHNVSDNAWNNGLGNDPGNAVQYVAAAAPLRGCKVPGKKRSCARKALIMMVAAGLVFAFMVPALVIRAKRGPHRTEATRVEIDGRIWETKITHPIMEPTKRP